jgi:phosphatidylinositol dimannoside acyltransferase
MSGLRRWSPNGLLLRRLAYLGARYFPGFWLRYTPPLFGLALGFAQGEKRRAVRRNLRAVLGPRSYIAEQVSVAHTFASFASCLAEGLALGRKEAEQAVCSVRDESRIRALLGNGRGVVLVTAHAGPWEAAAALLGKRLDVDVMIAMAPEVDPGARSLHDQVRGEAGVEVVHAGTDPLDSLPLLRHVRRGGVVALQLDRTLRGGRTLESQLFGLPFLVPEGPFRLAAVARVPVLPLFARRNGCFDYEVVVGTPIELSSRPSPEEVQAAAADAVGQMERFIRDNPTQWFHFESQAGSIAQGD